MRRANRDLRALLSEDMPLAWIQRGLVAGAWLAILGLLTFGQ